MPRRRSRRRELHPSGPPTREEMNALEERIQYVEQKAKMGHGISGVLSGEPDVDDSYLYDWDGNAATATEATNAGTVGGYLPDEIPHITDGGAPASSPTPTVAGGPRYLSVKWGAIANVDFVTYEVHVSDTASFTPDASTLVGETPGLLAFVYRDGAGDAFLYETDYYVQIVAKDSDGSAAAGVEVGPTQLDPNGTEDILAGSITAEHFEAVMAMASAMLAGTWGGTNVQTGYGVKDDGSGNPVVDPTFVGIRAYDGSGDTDPVFRVDASDGTVQVKGRIYFGAAYGSKLTRNDMVQVAEQPGGAWMNVALEQSFSVADNDSASVDVSWPAPPTPGRELLVVVSSWDAGGSPNHSWSGTKYTSIKNNAFDSSLGRHQIFKRVATGSDDDTLLLDVTADLVVVQCFEFSGVDDVEDGASATNQGTTSPADTGTSGAVSQHGLVFGSIALFGNFVSGHGAFHPDFAGAPPAGFTQIGDDGAQDSSDLLFRFGNELHSRVWMSVEDSGTQQISSAIADTDAWRGSIVSFKAKANAVESADADSARIYTRDIGGVSVFCVVDEAGEQRSLAYGKSGERWDFEVMSGVLNLPSIPADTSTTQSVPVTGVAVGDACIFQDKANLNRSLVIRAEPFCTVADQIQIGVFNASSGTIDPASDTFYFLVIHRS